MSEGAEKILVSGSQPHVQRASEVDPRRMDLGHPNDFMLKSK